MPERESHERQFRSQGWFLCGVGTRLDPLPLLLLLYYPLAMRVAMEHVLGQFSRLNSLDATR